ncbi:transmembrane protein, putative [Medicago truncatula]|uniref:Transmembrane protein, putative n=1 Tax=Medicago truncatula TaxID=3880 RepID=A0A072TYB0_MEDTR|nr:transmembrane protein, putative [Medicago truncatula]
MSPEKMTRSGRSCSGAVWFNGLWIPRSLCMICVVSVGIRRFWIKLTTKLLTRGHGPNDFQED